MPQLAASADKALLDLLRRVSRSFFLSVWLLPAGLRRPVAVGYLLARASDTLADAPGLAATDRAQQLAAFAGAIAHQRPFAPEIAAALEDEGERALLLALPNWMGWMDALDPADQEDVRAVLAHITRGQRLDVERFGAASLERPAALASAAQLDEYTYLVAGCVGEFWTRLGFRHLPEFADRPVSEMLDLGRRYGMALQLVNVLRDAGADLASGRCYLPADELRAAGLAPETILTEPNRLQGVCQPWQARAQVGLEDGIRYSLAVRSRRVRAASALPALLGTRTLALLQEAGASALERNVKMPRSEVRRVLWRMAVTLAGRSALQGQFEGLRE
jgi:farnesyl-diphosphate farnesyltransferase